MSRLWGIYDTSLNSNFTFEDWDGGDDNTRWA